MRSWRANEGLPDLQGMTLDLCLPSLLGPWETSQRAQRKPKNDNVTTPRARGVFHSARAFSDTFSSGATLDLSFFFYEVRALGSMIPEVLSPIGTFCGLPYPKDTPGM